MNLRKLIFTHNACYKTAREITPKGIMVHSTGANNPHLKRYVGPDDGLLGVNHNNNHWNQDKPDGRQVCVHAFIGKLADGSVATYQTLPWNHKGWHGGCGVNGSVNDSHISFEICEDGLVDAVYFGTAYQEAVELCAYLCKMYTLNPIKDGVIIGHYEGYKRGLASNHSDPGHWFVKHGKSMDTFRTAVSTCLTGSINIISPVSITKGSLVEIKSGTTNYYPDSTKIPTWVISDYYHRVTKVESDGKPVIKGNKLCVLLGKKIKKSGNAEEAGINTWVDTDALSVVDETPSGDTYNTYTVKQNDTLWRIAEIKLGDGSRYPEIKVLNELVSNNILEGQVLKIPW